MIKMVKPSRAQKPSKGLQFHAETLRDAFKLREHLLSVSAQDVRTSGRWRIKSWLQTLQTSGVVLSALRSVKQEACGNYLSVLLHV